MTKPIEVHISPESLERFRSLVGDEAVDEVLGLWRQLAPRGGDRTFWNVNSTPAGGGVAEMLASLLPYARGVGVDARWLVIGGDQEFFRLTKRLHNALHGFEGDGSGLGETGRQAYELVLEDNFRSWPRSSAGMTSSSSTIHRQQGWYRASRRSAPWSSGAVISAPRSRTSRLASVGPSCCPI
jgi:hypothetical protein